MAPERLHELHVEPGRDVEQRARIDHNGVLARGPKRGLRGGYSTGCLKESSAKDHRLSINPEARPLYTGAGTSRAATGPEDGLATAYQRIGDVQGNASEANPGNTKRANQQATSDYAIAPHPRYGPPAGDGAG